MADYTVDQLYGKLERADAAGDTEAAKVIADEIRRIQGQPKPRADFSGVKASVSSTERITSAPGATKVEQPAEPKRGNAVTRFLGDIGAREVMQGAYGLYGALGGDALNQYVLNPIDRALFPAEQNLSGLITGEQPQQRSVFGIGNQSYRDAAAAQADEWGMRRPETAAQKVVADVGEGLTGTALTMGLGGLLNAGRQAVQTTAPTVANRLGDFLTAQPVLQAVSTATGTGAGSVARESGAGQGTQAAASVLGALAPGGASYATGAGLRGLARGRDGTQMQQTIDDFAKLGATPSVGQASGNRMVQGAENLLAGGPTSAGVMGRFAEKQAEQIGAGLQQQGESLMRNASGERAGRAIERGMDTFKGNTGATKRALYWQVDQLMPGQKPVNLSNTWREVVQLTTPTPGAQATTTALINPRIQQLRDTLQQDIAAGGGQISYEAMKRIRSDIGEAITDFSLSPDTPTRELKRLYGALSRDMEEAARAQGPAAVAAAKRANNYTRAVADRMETVQRVIDKNGGPEKVFEAAMAGTRDGGTTLRAVMQSLPQEGQKAVTAAVIKRMGLATPGAQDAAGDVFSAQTFLTNWNKVSPEAKRALFDRYGPQFTKDMDRVARVAQNIRDGSKVFANPSGTANRAAAMTYGASLVGSLFTGGTALLAGSGVGANLLARWMTNPATVRRLATVTALPKGSIPVAIQAMRQVAEKDNDEDVAALADELENRESEAR
jgi:hypothetical protein